MYPSEYEASLRAVEAARKDNIACEPARMTAQEKDALLAAYHPDYKKSAFATLQIGPNQGKQYRVSCARFCRLTAEYLLPM